MKKEFEKKRRMCDEENYVDLQCRNVNQFIGAEDGGSS